MRGSECTRVIVIGAGTIYKRICALVKEHQGHFQICFIKYDNKSKCADCEMWDSMRQNQKISIKDRLGGIVEPTLIVNAGAFFIYPKCLLENKNLLAINYHNALLPDYKGRNAASWVIFNGEKHTGVTWHVVTEEIDGGDIIMQEELEIGASERAYELERRQAGLAYELFKRLWEIWSDGGELPAGTAAKNRQGRQYYAGELPNGGIINLGHDSGEQISRILRSMDYGRMPVFPPVVLIDYDGNEYTVKKYRIGSSGLCSENNEFSIRLNGTESIKITVKRKAGT